MSRLISALALWLVPALVAGAEPFRKLSDGEIRQRLATMEVTDGVHWAEIYNRDGSVTVWGMGQRTKGSWRVEKGELCVELPRRDRLCREVWMSGASAIEFRLPGVDAPTEARLIKPQPRP